MAICTFRSKVDVVYEPIKKLKARVYYDMNTITVSTNGYYSRGEYYAVVNGKRISLKNDSDTFDRATAVQLFTMLGATGDNFDAQIFDLIPKVVAYGLSQATLWGLTGDDWELVP